MKPKTIDEYIALQPVTHREMLEKIRKAIRSAAPAAEETISYMIPSFKLNGLLVGFGANKKGCSFYPMSGSILDEFTDEITSYSRTKGALHLDFDKKLPLALIKKITKARLKENIEKASLKNKSKVNYDKKNKNYRGNSRSRAYRKGVENVERA